jgi:CAAX prenyl protease-like protein
MPYLIPFFVFVLIMTPGSMGTVGGIDVGALWHQYHPVVYASKSIAAALLLWYFWPAYARIRWAKLPLGAVVGLVGTPVWIGIHYACLATGVWTAPDPATLYNPDLMLGSPAARWAYLCIRVAGPTLVVPVMEELFFRDFLMRALVRGARFEDVPVGTYTPLALFGMAVLFGLNHGSMWPGGLVYGLMMGVLLIRTKSLGACIVAHAVTNLTLYLYVIYTGDWQFM